MEWRGSGLRHWQDLGSNSALTLMSCGCAWATESLSLKQGCCGERPVCKSLPLSVDTKWTLNIFYELSFAL